MDRPTWALGGLEVSLFGGKRKSGSAGTDGGDSANALTPASGTGSASDAAEASNGSASAKARDAGSRREGPGSSGSSKKRGTEGPQTGGKSVANIGKSIIIKGDLSGDEDLVIEGEVEGRIHLASHQLTIGANGRITAEVEAQGVVVIGRLTGNIAARERVEIQATGIVEGDIRAPKLLIQEGAIVNGRIEMTKTEVPVKGATSDTAPKTAPKAPTAPEQARKTA
jgi:cytoskeletal protein CcmA (bactofilin family)